MGMASICPAQTSQITVDASVVLNRIPDTLYSLCIEDVNHEIYGGLYNQRIMGESFEEPASGVDYAYWKNTGATEPPTGNTATVAYPLYPVDVPDAWWQWGVE